MQLIQDDFAPIMLEMQHMRSALAGLHFHDVSVPPPSARPPFLAPVAERTSKPVPTRRVVPSSAYVAGFKQMSERWAALDKESRAVDDLVKLLASDSSDEKSRKLIHNVAAVRRFCIGIDGLVEGYKSCGAQVKGAEAKDFEGFAERLSTVVAGMRAALDTLDTVLDKAIALSITARRNENPYSTLGKSVEDGDWDSAVQAIAESMVAQ